MTVGTTFLLYLPFYTDIKSLFFRFIRALLIVNRSVYWLTTGRDRAVLPTLCVLFSNSSLLEQDLDLWLVEVYDERIRRSGFESAVSLSSPPGPGSRMADISR